MILMNALEAHRQRYPELHAAIAKAGPATATPTVPVYEWLDESGQPNGLGTKLEFDHWRAEGVIPETDRLGGVLCHEPAIEDERRKAAWAGPAGQMGRVA
jgi:hypothetical protein